MAKYTSCKWIEHGIVFDQCNMVRICCIYNSDYGDRPKIWGNYTGETNWKDLFRIKREHRNRFKNGNILPECKDCFYLREKDWDDDDYIDRMILTPWYECNSKCIYCTPTDDPDLLNTRKYDVTKVISSMMENNVLAKNASIDFAGGEPTIYEDFEALLSLFIDYGIKDILIHSSAVKFSPSIEKGIEKDIIRLVVSIDAGTKEMHRKIKGVDSYDRVWANLTKYVQAQKENKTKVKAKYIIVPGVNDSEYEIDLWLNKCLSVGITSVALNLDQNWFRDNINKSDLMTQYNLMSYTAKKAEELNLMFELYPQCTQLKIKVEAEMHLQSLEGK